MAHPQKHGDRKHIWLFSRLLIWWLLHAATDRSAIGQDGAGAAHADPARLARAKQLESVAEDVQESVLSADADAVGPAIDAQGEQETAFLVGGGHRPSPPAPLSRKRERGNRQIGHPSPAGSGGRGD